MRVATFNLESLDEPVEPRAAVLRPALERLEADVLCLQEVNGQHVAGRRDRAFRALDVLLVGTPYASYHRSATRSPGRTGPADVHNLVTLSRFAIREERQLLHEAVPPAQVSLVTAEPPTTDAVEVRFERPVLLTGLDCGGRLITIVNVHLRAPIASAIPGQKSGPFSWRTSGAWAEGYYLSGIKRIGQALELRLLVDGLLDADPGAHLLLTGDFNAEANETPLRLLAAAPEDTGNADLAGRSLVVLDRAIPVSRRFSVVHHGRPQMLDHMLASHALYGRFRGIEVHNEALGDEAIGWAKGVGEGGSYHAGVVATFAD
ncbi:MAG: endonuclease/exonuclease/phosphatase family protein [Hyphomicrobiaceae bacterium]|nr:endonuclease/exonuclease/phosphatase family protein [Hyphomicrobiaceae bacterium]